VAPGGFMDSDNVSDVVNEEASDAIEEGQERYEAEPEVEEVRVEAVPPYQAEPRPDFSQLEKYDFNFSAGNNKWIFDSENLAGNPISNTVFVYPQNQDPRVDYAYPPNIPAPSQRMMRDTFRFATGKYWMNLAHGNGPTNGLAQFLENRRPDGPSGLLAFHNPTDELGKDKCFLAEVTQEELDTGRVVDPSDWRYGNVIRSQYGMKNLELDLPIYEESMKIVFPPHPLMVQAAEASARIAAMVAANAEEPEPEAEEAAPAPAGPYGNDPANPFAAGAPAPPGQNEGGMGFFEDDDTPKEEFDEGRETVGEAEERRQGGQIFFRGWNWRNYMYGLSGHTYQTAIEWRGLQRSLLTVRRREANRASPPPSLKTFGGGSELEWPNWSQATYSKNMFPVIPFFGPDATYEILEEGPEGQLPWFDMSYRPPTTGEQTFFDHVTYVPAFLTREEANQAGTRAGSFFDIDAHYNFYDCVYEDLISPLYSEKRLPNFYRMRPENFSPSRFAKSEEEYRRGSVVAALRADERDELIKRKAFEEYGIFDYALFPNRKKDWEIYTKTNLPEFQKVYEDRRLFPMHAEIEFSDHPAQRNLDAATFFAGAMKLGPYMSAVNDILQPFAAANDPETLSLKYQPITKKMWRSLKRGRQPRRRDIADREFLVKTLSAETVEQMSARGDTTEDGITFNVGATNFSVGDTLQEEIKYIELDHWLKWLKDALDFRRDKEFIHSDSRGDKKTYVFTYEAIKARIRSIIERKYRSDFKQVLSGVPAYSETLAYRVEKTGDGMFPQNFYFGTDKEVDMLRYVDSQVKYGKRYNYKVYKTIITVGTEYAYVDCMSGGSVQRFFRETEFPQRVPASMFFGVIHTPNVRIMEVPMVDREVVILDRPPMPPDVNVIPFKGDATRVLFYLNSGTGQLYAPPIILEEDDNEQFANVAINQRATFDPESWLPPGGVANPEEVVHFKNDDQTKIFEVFRIEDEPTSWQDFYDEKIERIVSEATNATFEDSIVPNKKYYYTFRSEDQHGHVSNPTHIYQVEMIKNSETVYMKMDLFRFKEPVKQRTESFSKTIQIQPSFIQRIIDLPTTGMFSDWEVDKKVGNSRYPVWGKKFKFRITSKSTGKQIDLNFKFVKKHATIAEEVQNTVQNNDKC